MPDLTPGIDVANCQENTDQGTGSNNGLSRRKLIIEYDGTRYNGWQIQKNAPSVQAALEKAASHLAGIPIRIRGAGRTDAGVHARGQVGVADFPASLPIEKTPEAMNSRLPDDVAVTDAAETDKAFDPRRDCIRKQYSYTFTLGPVRPALFSRRSWHIKRPVDVEAMIRVAEVFRGVHDFTSFCNRELAGGDNLRTVDRSELQEIEPDSQGRRRLVYRVEGRSFLYNQVRAMAGMLYGIGTKRFSEDSIDSIFAARDRAAAGESAPPWGLCLEWVLYPGQNQPDDRPPLSL